MGSKQTGRHTYIYIYIYIYIHTHTHTVLHCPPLDTKLRRALRGKKFFREVSAGHGGVRRASLAVGGAAEAST